MLTKFALEMVDDSGQTRQVHGGRAHVTGMVLDTPLLQALIDAFSGKEPLL